jgi:hypothetical protein
MHTAIHSGIQYTRSPISKIKMRKTELPIPCCVRCGHKERRVRRRWCLRRRRDVEAAEEEELQVARAEVGEPPQIISQIERSHPRRARVHQPSAPRRVPDLLLASSMTLEGSWDCTYLVCLARSRQLSDCKYSGSGAVVRLSHHWTPLALVGGRMPDAKSHEVEMPRRRWAEMPCKPTLSSPCLSPAIGDGSRSSRFLQLELPTVRPAPSSVGRDPVVASFELQHHLLQGRNQWVAAFSGSNSTPSAPALFPVRRNMVTTPPKALGSFPLCFQLWNPTKARRGTWDVGRAIRVYWRWFARRFFSCGSIDGVKEDVPTSIGHHL